MYITQKGSYLEEEAISPELFDQEIERIGPHLRVIAGHDLRPYGFIGTDVFDRFAWVTFLRDPVERFISHFFYDYQRSNAFAYPKYTGMREISIQEWNSIEKVSNYQTRFLAGSDSLEDAKDILSRYFRWVGVTAFFADGLESFSRRFGLKGFDFTETRANSRTGADSNAIINIDRDYVVECNRSDIELYRFVKHDLWPEFRKTREFEVVGSPNPKFIQTANELAFLMQKARKNKDIDLRLANILRFGRRWFS